jgi:pimeloyl-ACP methyl ester carboxylesterase
MLLPAFRASVQAHGLAATWTAMKALEAEQGVSEPDDPAVAAFMSNKFHANAPGSLLAMTAVLLAEPDSVADLAATGLPTLVAHGAADDGWPPDVQAEMARRLSATYVVWDGVGHSPAVDDPEMTASALTEFWQSVDGRDHIVK